VSLLKSIDTLLKVDVVGRELGLQATCQNDGCAIECEKLQPTLSSVWPNCSLVYWKVRDAKGVTEAPKLLF
jgi:hypothetical protein